jgi:hypothetical protein
MRLYEYHKNDSVVNKSYVFLVLRFIEFVFFSHAVTRNNKLECDDNQVLYVNRLEQSHIRNCTNCI